MRVEAGVSEQGTAWLVVTAETEGELSLLRALNAQAHGDRRAVVSQGGGSPATLANQALRVATVEHAPEVVHAHLHARIDQLERALTEERALANANRDAAHRWARVRALADEDRENRRNG